MRPLGGALVVAVVCAGVFFGSAAMHGHAAVPAAVTVTPGSHVITWQGTIPASGTRRTRDCNEAGAGRVEELDVVVALPTHATFTFSIAWTPISNDEASNDEVLSVDGPDGEIGSSDGSGTTETVVAEAPSPGTYRVLVCGDVNLVSQGYTGTVTVGAAAR